MSLNIAIQKSGRLYEDSVALLSAAGLKINQTKGQLKATVRNFDANVFFLRNADIPKYIEDGVADIAILGENTILEKGAQVEVHEHLGFQKCKLSIAFPKGVTDRNLEGKKIATSYPNTLGLYLKEKGVSADIHEISGSVEIAPNIGLADAICDLVSSGSTLFSNGLEEEEVILRSEACLVSTKNLIPEKAELLDQLLFRVRSVMSGRKNKYILMNVPNEQIEAISKVLPVLRSPTVLPLVKEGWSSLHSVIAEDDFWAAINKLKRLGAEGILVVPIEKMVV